MKLNFGIEKKTAEPLCNTVKSPGKGFKNNGSRNIAKYIRDQTNFIIRTNVEYWPPGFRNLLIDF